MGRKLGAVPIFWRGAGSPFAQCGLVRDLLSCQVASWSIHPFGHKIHGPKIRGLCPLFWGGGTGSNMGQGLPPYQVSSWSIQPFGHNRYGPKIGGLCSFEGGELGPHLTQCGQDRGLPACQVSSWSIQPFGHNAPTSQTDRTEQTDRQRSDSIEWTVLQTFTKMAKPIEMPSGGTLLCARWTTY